jgi:hypothetical protein
MLIDYQHKKVECNLVTFIFSTVFLPPSCIVLACCVCARVILMTKPKRHSAGADENVAALVKDQLRSCQALSAADWNTVQQSEKHSLEKTVAQANQLLLQLKADIRALNKCASRLQPISSAAALSHQHGPETETDEDVNDRVYDAVKLERILQQHPLLTVTAAARDRESTFRTAFDAVSELEALRGTLSTIVRTRLLLLNIYIHVHREPQLTAR